MAFRSLTRPLGLTYKPCTTITPSLFNLKKSYSGKNYYYPYHMAKLTYYLATPNINNKATNDKDQTKTPVDKIEEVKDDALKATTEKGKHIKLADTCKC